MKGFQNVGEDWDTDRSVMSKNKSARAGPFWYFVTVSIMQLLSVSIIHTWPDQHDVTRHHLWVGKFSACLNKGKRKRTERNKRRCEQRKEEAKQVNNKTDNKEINDINISHTNDAFMHSLYPAYIPGKVELPQLFL